MTQIATVQELLERGVSFREFVQDLFPNDVVDQGIVDEIERDLAFGPIVSACSISEILLFLSEIKVELQKEYPRVGLLLDDKLYLAVIFQKLDIEKVLEEERQDMLDFVPGLSSLQAGSDLYLDFHDGEFYPDHPEIAELEDFARKIN